MSVEIWALNALSQIARDANAAGYIRSAVLLVGHADLLGRGQDRAVEASMQSVLLDGEPSLRGHAADSLLAHGWGIVDRINREQNILDQRYVDFARTGGEDVVERIVSVREVDIPGEEIVERVEVDRFGGVVRREVELDDVLEFDEESAESDSSSDSSSDSESDEEVREEVIVTLPRRAYTARPIIPF